MQWFMDELRAAEEEQLRVLPFLLGKKRADQLRWSAIREFFECSRARDSDSTSLSRGSSAESDPDGSRRSTVALPIDPKASFKVMLVLNVEAHARYPPKQDDKRR